MRMLVLMIRSSLIAFVMISGVSAYSADMLQGLKAYQNGRYEEAYNNWMYFARRGNAEAQYNIANLYRRGEGVPADLEQAYMWMLFSAEAGLMAAQYNLGVMLLKGDGVISSQIRAEYWLKLAAKQNHQGAQKLLSELSKPNSVVTPIVAPVVVPVATPEPTPLPTPTPTPTPTSVEPNTPTPLIKPPVTPTPPPVLNIEVRFGSYGASEKWSNVLQRYKAAYGSLLKNQTFRSIKKEGVAFSQMWVYVSGFSSRTDAIIWCKEIRKLNGLQVCFLEQ